MPTVLRKYGYRFHFYSGENDEPPHIHVDGHGAKAKIWLENVSVSKAAGFGQKELARILSVVQEHREYFLEAWHDYFV
ncbi:DUF4160 domain-containing protein [Phyllobacterium leguminum]|uniref:Uncharacterized protein DUF4160 n=1 Tax=Phyllobacterium leguminum TaxID=314237 RepID=A0A318T1A4_9HYPH|nr:DUF4160 domain-containing protein [Phyllobacterium leguminum]PYE86359.1 uncharacterized protein DUF4160 [Phyllobacterium leguminum]